MPDFLRQLRQQVPLDTMELYVVAGLLGALIVLAVMFRAQLRHWRENRQIVRMVRQLGARSLRNLHLPDGTGGEVAIDYLLLTRDALLVVCVKRFSGHIYGGTRTDQWTQVVNRVSYKFPNPDEYLQRQINAVRQLAPGVTVSGVHLFTHGAEFPKGKPENVLSTRETGQLPKRVKPAEIPQALREAWSELVAAVS